MEQDFFHKSLFDKERMGSLCAIVSVECYYIHWISKIHEVLLHKLNFKEWTVLLIILEWNSDGDFVPG